jgi:hypothetical protein
MNGDRDFVRRLLLLWIPSARSATAPYRFVRFYRFMMCSARFSTFNAASLTASLKVGCE